MSTAAINLDATAVAPHLYWLASRAAGNAALLLSSASVCIGLSSSLRLFKGRAADLRLIHEALSLASIAALVVHVLTLLGDGFLHPSLAELTVPFLSDYETLWTTAGIVAFWMMLALGLSYYARARIGVARWRMLHRFTALAWVLGLAHSLGEGTDAGQAWFLAMVAIVTLPALALLAARGLKASLARSGGAGAQNELPGGHVGTARHAGAAR
ncbi:MAG TPA: ferric reductase-like transmembrane domain-containing protein [Solirubrobacteraceae bacterium]|jgi:sulfoxide reductase heme-binding subunit YedZ